MKYSFCYTMDKIINKDSNPGQNEKTVHFKNDKETEIEIKCGPWYDTLEEAKKDEELFKKDKQAFFKSIDKEE